MAPTSHVPSDLHPLQPQDIYNNPAYENLFPAGEQPAAQQPWTNSHLGHAGLMPNPGTQHYHFNSYLQQSQPQSQPRPQHQPAQQQQQPQPQSQPQPPSQSQPYTSMNQPYPSHAQLPYQYGQFENHGSLINYAHNANIDPSLNVDSSLLRQQQHSPYTLGVRNPPPQTQASTVAPQALQQHNLAVQPPRAVGSPYPAPKSTTPKIAPEAFPSQRPVQPAISNPPKNPEYTLPNLKKTGGFNHYDQSALAKATNSTPLNKFVTISNVPHYYATNRTTFPQYVPRQSVKDLRKAGADNKKLLAKKTTAKLLSSGKTIQRDVSDSESYDDSSDDSEYSSEEEEEEEPSPLPSSRPDDTHEATRYDVIKATWFPRKSRPNSEKIKLSLRDFWEICNTIQKRWRNDSKAVTEAEEQKKKYEIPELKKRVAGQRALLKTALRSALDFAHPDVLYHIGQVKPFLYLCYQFLANRFKMQDYDGDVPAAIYEVLAKCVGTLNTELLEQTKLIKALNSMKKNANERHKSLIQDIINGAAAGSKKPKVSPPLVSETAAESKTTKRPAALQGTGNGTPKKLKPAESTANGEKKSSASVVPVKAVTAAASSQKRPGEKVAPTSAKPRGTQIVNKPSALFASLTAASKKPTSTSTSSSTATPSTKSAASASKDKKPAAAASAKPAFSFAETMAQLLKPKEEEPVAPVKSEKQLPPETPEEKAKRLRKESRRHLRVSFRPDASLVAIRYFNHDPEEESGHDENFVRDAGDIGGEGRMFKQHKEMMDDEDEDELETEYLTWKEPSEIDFSNVNPEERARNYAPFGGGQCVPTCPEKEANIQHEFTTLMIFYAHPGDIPSSPREPLEQQTRPSPSAPVTNFGQPPDWTLKRAQTSTPAAALTDFSSLENMIKQLSTPAVPQQPTADQASYTPPLVASTSAPTTSVSMPTSVPPVPDLAAILSALGQGQTQAPAQPQMTYPTSQQPAAAPLDLNAIMAAVSGGNPAFPQVAPPPPQAGWAGFPGFSLPPSDAAAAYQQNQPQQAQHTRNGHKRQRDDSVDNDRDNNPTKKNKFGGFIPKRHKVIPCRFYAKGQCNKGDDCTYIHDTT
ncbi:unnamed protein product [Periconia digitata]|uniref:C3H1-type domain-containing protein n=1 Tax=Periconia digitata TaxID=1303443 RepID=A0A9W4U7A5_9PLEO|nr:unnamed protein product [Periconia digitata]